MAALAGSTGLAVREPGPYVAVLGLLGSLRSPNEAGR